MIFDNLRHDLKYALRGLRLKPGFAIAVVVTLGLGIGANAAMFGIVDRLLFRPPALMKDPATAHRLYVAQTFRGKEHINNPSQYARYLDFKKLTHSFSDVAGYTPRDLAIGVGEAAREMRVGVVSANFFRFFDAPPALGRYFTEAEDNPRDPASVAVLSYAMWQANYGGRRDVLGKPIQIGPKTYTIIGVSPPGFVGLWADKPPAAYISLTAYAPSHRDPRRGTRGTGGRRTAGDGCRRWCVASPASRRPPRTPISPTRSVRASQQQRIEQPGTPPDSVMRPRAMIGSILYERGPNASSVAKVATWVGGVSVIVLLIACANVANLLLARALKRRREIALRLALGVSRGRLFAQLLTESMLLAVLGGVTGLVVAHWGGAALRAGLLDKSEAPAGLRDPRTVLFAAGAAIVVGLLTGLAPVLQAGRANLTGDLKSGVARRHVPPIESTRRAARAPGDALGGAAGRRGPVRPEPAKRRAARDWATTSSP